MSVPYLSNYFSDDFLLELPTYVHKYMYPFLYTSKKMRVTFSLKKK